MHANENSEIITLFTYRYLLDEPQPPHDSKQDIEDLRVFPERLEVSHVDEWRSDVVKQIHTTQLSSFS